MLPKFIKDAELRLPDFEDCMILRNTLETSDVTGGGPELFLYQSGYLTIKSCVGNVYHLGFPNEEVKQALYKKTTHHIYIIELKLRNNGGKDAAIKQIQNRQYLEPFKADKREVVGLGIELDEEGKGVLDWEMVNEE